MKKTWWIVLGSIILLFLTSSYPMGDRDGIVGHEAPDFALQSETNKVESAALRGKVIVVSFWRAADAQSRIDNVRYQRALAQAGDENVQFVSVNLDRDKSLADNIALADGIPAQCTYNINDAVLGNLIEDYHLQDGCRTYVIGTDGKIISVNPEVADIARI